MSREEENAACPSLPCPSHWLVYLAALPSPPALSPGSSGDWMAKVWDGPAYFPIMAYLFQLFFCSPSVPFDFITLALGFFPLSALLSVTHSLMVGDSVSS